MKLQISSNNKSQQYLDHLTHTLPSNTYTLVVGKASRRINPPKGPKHWGKKDLITNLTFQLLNFSLVYSFNS